MPPCELKTNAPPQLRGAHRYPESVVPGGGQGAPDYGRGARGTHLTRGSFSGTAGSSRHLQGQQQHAVLSQSLSPMESEVPRRRRATLGEPRRRAPLHGISQARQLEWVAISFFGGSSQPRDQTRVPGCL